MGVYIELYTPIFNYNSMSQVIKKFEPGGKTTQPRLYKRGNDDIDLDAYIRDAESEFSYWLANSRLKDKEKQQVQEAYSQMLQGINDGTFTYKIGGGYNNSVGMSNKTKGFDAAGLAAGFLGNILRNQSVYTAPEEKPDPSKIEWKGNSSIGAALVRRLYGSDKENLNDFIDLDLPDPKTKKRGNVNRSARFKSGLEYIRDNFDNLFTSFSDSDKATALEGINSALSAFSNGTVEDNEYLDLSRATGMSNLRDMFFAGEKYGSTTQTPGTTPQGTGSNDGGSVYTNEDDWRAAKYPKLNTKLAGTFSLKDPTIYGQWSRQALHNHLSKLDDQTLFDLINYGLSKNVQLYQNPKIVSYAGIGNNPVPFTNKYVINNILKILKDSRNLSQYADVSGNQFYIKGSYDKKRGTGLVWNMFDNTINEMSIHDIPWWITKMHNEFIAQVPSNKNGGTLRKFAVGGVSNVGYNADKYSWDDIIYGSNQFASVLGSLNKSNYEEANKLQNRFFTDKINDKWDEGTLKRRDEVAAYQTDFNNAYGAHLNQGAIEDAIKAGLIKRAGVTGDNASNSTPYSDGYSGAITNLRHLGTSDHVQYLDEMNEILHQNGLYAFLNKDTNMINYGIWEDPVAARKAVVASTQSPQAVSEEQLFGGKPEEHSDAWKKVFGQDVGGDSVEEKFLPSLSVTPKTGSFGSFMAGLTPDLIGAGRLWASLHTNNRVYDTVLPSLKPVLKDTYERYSPVTGAFSARQFKNRQGADVLRQSNQAFTSDASLAAARMLEGQRQANQLQAEGFLADDQEIRRTQAEALARQEDNMARRSEVANFNRASINQTNRERAQLEATRLKSNWQSWDNFLQGFESRIRTRMDENRERANNFYDKLSASQAEEWYNTVMEPADRAYAAWQKANVGADPATEWGGGKEWEKYVRHKREARARANAMIYQGMADRYGLQYTNPYTEESNALFNWNRRYV